MKKSYLPQLQALEEFCRYAMKFRMKLENPYGKKVSHKISGIRISYLEKESVFQSFSGGIQDFIRKSSASPQVFVTLFYKHYEKGKVIKEVKLCFSFATPLCANKEGLLRALKQNFPSAVYRLLKEFYSVELADQNEHLDAATQTVCLEDSEFELSSLEMIPESLAKQAKNLTQSLYQLPYVCMADSQLKAERTLWIVVDHTGHRVISHRDVYSLSVSIELLNPKKESLEQSFGGSYLSWDEVSRGLEEKHGEIQDFLYSRQRKQLESGIYPLLLAPSAVGTLFHEAIGAHMLSGAYIAEGISTVFKQKINKPLAKGGFMEALKEIKLWDAPLDKHMVAHYRYDMEGVPAKDVLLIDSGVVKDYLHSRNSAARLKMENNGHALAQSFIRQVRVNNEDYDGFVCPEPRVSNLKILAKNPIPLEEVKSALFEEFGYYFEVESYAGEVFVETGIFELYVDKLVKVYPNGKRKYYYGGTLSANLTDFISAIKLISDHYGSSQGYCGAGSGYIPTEEYAPAMAVYGVNWASEDLPKKDLITNLTRDKYFAEENVPQMFES